MCVLFENLQEQNHKELLIFGTNYLLNVHKTKFYLFTELRFIFIISSFCVAVESILRGKFTCATLVLT